VRTSRRTKNPGRQKKLSNKEIIEFFGRFQEEEARVDANWSRAIEFMNEALSLFQRRPPEYKHAFELTRKARQLLENTELNSRYFSGFQYLLDRLESGQAAFKKIEAWRSKGKPASNEILKFVTGQRNYPKRGWERFELFIKAVKRGYEITGFGITLDRSSLGKLKQREQLENTRLNEIQLLLLQYCYESWWDTTKTENLRKIAACARSKKHDERKKAPVRNFHWH
jgi:hypothetical protein